MELHENIIKELEESLISKSNDIKALYMQLDEKENITQKIIKDLTSKINKLEKLLNIDNSTKEEQSVEIFKAKRSIQNNDGIIVEREYLDDF